MKGIKGVMEDLAEPLQRWGYHELKIGKTTEEEVDGVVGILKFCFCNATISN